MVGDKKVGKSSIVNLVSEGIFESLSYESMGDGWEETANKKGEINASLGKGKKETPVRIYIRAATRVKDYKFRTQSFRNPYR